MKNKVSISIIIVYATITLATMVFHKEIADIIPRNILYSAAGICMIILAFFMIKKLLSKKNVQ